MLPSSLCRLTAGADNILLHYLCVEAGQGVWLGPIHHDSSLYGTIHHEMITSFQTTCTAIRAILLAKTQVGDVSIECNCGFIMIFMTLNPRTRKRVMMNGLETVRKKMTKRTRY